MGAMRFSGTGLVDGRRRGSRAALMLRGVGVMVALLMVLVVAPSGASAESLCTDTWTGPSEGEWQVASDWSTGKVPSSSDVACVGSGKTVKIKSGSDVAGVLQGEGGVSISGGSLEVADTLEVSSVHSVTMKGGTLTGAATVDISGSLVWNEGKMTGSGSTVLKPEATARIYAAGSATITERKLVNEGTVTLAAGKLELTSGATVTNSGTFYANDNEHACGECSGGGINKGSGTAKFTNTGVVEKDEGSNEVGFTVNFENQGTIDGKTGKLAFYTGSSSEFDSGSTVAGSILIQGGSVTGGSFKTSSASLTITSGSLTMSEGSHSPSSRRSGCW